MNYENNFTRANPGLIIIMVDQSKSMEDPWSGGKSLAEHTAMSINRCISEMGLRFTEGTTIKESANIVVIGYGGIKDSWEAQILRNGSITELCNDSSIPVQHLKQMIPDGAGGVIEIDVDLKEFVTPTAVWGTPMASAFQLANSIVKGWIERDDPSHDFTKDPVPMIVNISDGEPTDSEADVRKYAQEILSTACPDGFPLIFNIHLSASGGVEVCLPTDDSKLPANDKMSHLLYDISSALPESMVQAAKENGFPEAEANAKTFMSNVTEVQKFIRFLNFGTKGTGGNIR